MLKPVITGERTIAKAVELGARTRVEPLDRIIR